MRYNGAIQVITCKNDLKQNDGSTVDFKSRFRIHKSNIKTDRDICRTARHFNGKCKDSYNISQFLSVQITGQSYGNTNDFENILPNRKKILPNPILYS